MTKLKDYWDSFKVSSNNLIERIAQKLVELNMMAALPGGGPFDSGNPGKPPAGSGMGNWTAHPAVTVALFATVGALVGVAYLWVTGPRELQSHEEQEGKPSEVRLQEILAEEKAHSEFKRHEVAKKFKEDDDDAWMNKGNDADSGGVD